MTRHARLSTLLALVLAPAMAMGWLIAPSAPDRVARAAAPVAGAEAWTDGPPTAGLAAWTGEVQLYRRGTFTTQQSWLWCTAAGVQIARNIVFDETDHSASSQRRYFSWMRERNHYDLPVSAGVDPAGWTAGMRRFVDDRYRLVSSRTFKDGLRSAAMRIRQTRLPVAIAVSHGGHGWLLVGFTATADPAATQAFEVTSVRIVGPLWGLQSKGGYDMAPNTKLTPSQLRRFFTAWRYDPLPMVWDGRFISIQPIPGKGSAAAVPSPQASPSPRPSPSRSPVPSLLPSPAAAPSRSPAPSPTPPLSGQAGDTSPAASLTAEVPPSPAAGRLVDIGQPSGLGVMAVVALAVVALGSLLALGVARRRR